MKRKRINFASLDLEMLRGMLQTTEKNKNALITQAMTVIVIAAQVKGAYTFTGREMEALRRECRFNQKTLRILSEIFSEAFTLDSETFTINALEHSYSVREQKSVAGTNSANKKKAAKAFAKSENVSKTDTPKTPKAIETVKEPTQKPMYTFQNPPKKTAQYYKDNKAKAPVTQKEREFTTEPILVTMDDKKALAVFRRENSLEQWNTFLTNRDATTVTKDYWENATASGLMAGEYWNWKVNGIVPNKEACKSRVTYNKR